MTIKMLSVDLGASSGRVIANYYDEANQRIRMSEVYRFDNDMIAVGHHLYWNILDLFQQIKIGIKKSVEDNIDIKSLSIDTWGVDYCYLDKQGNMISFPHCYRDTRMANYQQQFYDIMAPYHLFEVSGVYPDSINSIMQIYADIQHNPYLLDIVDKVLFMPDALNYLLTNQIACDYTIASTSGLLDIHSHQWSTEIFQTLGIPPHWFAKITIGGQVLGQLSPTLCEELQIAPFDVVVGASHDTAAAVLTVPQIEQSHIFLSCGTWSLVGVEQSAPLINEAAFAQQLTNEGSFLGDYRILKNITGLWLIQQLRRDWQLSGEAISYEMMVKLAQSVSDNETLIDVNHKALMLPGHIEQKIIDYCQQSGQVLPRHKGHVIRIILESLAYTYHQTITDLEQSLNQHFTTIRMVGGGIQNELLCQLTANFTNKIVIAGPIEASAMGNVLSQLLVYHLITPQDIKHIVDNSSQLIKYIPQSR